ncbi:uncharacterized protein LOC135202131 [Macrobrachium nipponense]|uniref:uncharacterized protein LOC135202131 n=1 Tax=Macrobrachium nipponense TaxID=159736 RepID=UPI0030C7FA9E
MSKKVVVSDVHNLSETSDDDNIPPAQPKKKRCPKTEETSQEPSNSEILQLLLLQNQTLLKLVEKGSGSTAKRNDNTPPPKRPRRKVDLPENANEELFTTYNEDSSDYEEFNPLTFNKPIPTYISNNFNAVPSIHRDGKIQLNDSLIALTLSEGDKNSHDQFFVCNHNKELADLFKLINLPKLNFWPSGRLFNEDFKKKFHFDIENIKMAISSFQGHAALAQLAYPSKINNIDFITKVIIGPFRKHIDLIKSLIRSFRSRSLPRNLNLDTRDAIIKAETNDIWVLSDDQRKLLLHAFEAVPFLEEGTFL